MVNMGFGNMSWTDIQWRVSEFGSWNFSYIYRSDTEQNIYGVLKDNLDLIGINLTEGGLSYHEYRFKSGLYKPIWTNPYAWFERQNFVILGWLPEYPDAYEIFHYFFSSNGFFPQEFNPITDPWIEQKIEQASQEFNDTARAVLYSEIQRYLNEEFFALIYLYHNPVMYIHNRNLKSVPYNPTGFFYAYPIEFEE